MKIQQIIRHLEHLVPLSYQEAYDNCGLLVGNPDMECEGVLLSLDITPEVMIEARNKKCNLLISHHPVIFKGIKRLTSQQPETEILTAAIKNDIAIYAIHTNLDNVINGLNAHVLSKIGARDFQILSPKADLLLKLVVFCPVDHAEKVRQAIFDAGAGHIGNYDCCSFNIPGQGTFRASKEANPFVGEKDKLHAEPEIRIEVIFPDYLKNSVLKSMLNVHPYEEVAYDLYPLKNDLSSVGAGLQGVLKQPVEADVFLNLLKKNLNLPLIRHTEIPDKKISKVAICTGSGSFLINNALRSGCDVYITADLKYHDFFVRKNQLLLADIGHYESEQWVKEWLHGILIEKFPNFAFLISEVNTNPIHYL